MDKDSGLPRVFGGLNVLCLGDFWQLPPTGQISIMSNPYSNHVLECAKHHSVMSMFWLGGHREALQTWQHNGKRVLHLIENMRSGKDAWFSRLLDSCREGSMSANDYNFLHGFPTVCRVDADCENEKCLGLKSIKQRHAKWSDALADANSSSVRNAKPNTNVAPEFWAVRVLEACRRRKGKRSWTAQILRVASTSPSATNPSAYTA